MSIQNYVYNLEPGGQEFQGVGSSDFIFCKFADRPIDLIIDNETVTLERGGEYESRRGQFSNFTIKNPDPDNPAAVILVIGTDRYRSRIITGEVTITPGVRNAAGLFVDDTRYDLALTLALDGQFSPTTYQRKDQFTVFSALEASNGAGDGVMRGPAGSLVVYETFDTGNNWFVYGQYDPDGSRLGTVNLRRTGVGGSDYALNCISHYGGNQYVGANYGADLITIRGKSGGYTVGTTANRPEHIKYDALSDKIYVLTDDGFGANAVEVWTPGNPGSRDKIIDVTALTGRRNADTLDVVDGVLYVADAVNAYLYAINLNASPETVLFDESGWSVGEGLVLSGQNFYSGFGTDPIVVKALASEEYTLAAKGSVVAGAGGASLVRFFKPNQLDFVTQAGVTFTDSDGVLQVSGELIRATLEMYFRKQVAADYLDHVHGLEIHSFVTGPGLPPGQQITKSNGKTFAAAKITDSFEQVLPGFIVVTLDAGLTFEE